MARASASIRTRSVCSNQQSCQQLLSVHYANLARQRPAPSHAASPSPDSASLHSTEPLVQLCSHHILSLPRESPPACGHTLPCSPRLLPEPVTAEDAHHHEQRFLLGRA